MTGPDETERTATARAKGAEARALKHLRLAFQEGRDELSCEWVERDPDLDAIRREVRDDDTGWRLLKQRYCTSKAATKPVSGREIRRATPTLRGETDALRGYPARPWGDPVPRRKFWMAVAGICLLLAALAIALTDRFTTARWVDLTALGVIFVGAWFRVTHFILDARRIRRER